MTHVPSQQFSAEPPPSAALLRALAAHPELMADLISALSGRVHDADSLLDLMARSAREAVRVLDHVDSAGVTAQFDGQPFTAAHTDERVLVVDERQYAQQDGPCLRAMRTDSRVSMSFDQVSAIWPHLADAARRVGVQSFLALPLHAREASVGSLNMYSADADSLDVSDPDLLTVLAEYLSRGLTDYADSLAAHPLEAALREALSRRAQIDQAIGVLMAIYGFGPDYAREVLREQARDSGLQLVEQAAQVIATNVPPHR